MAVPLFVARLPGIHGDAQEQQGDLNRQKHRPPHRRRKKHNSFDFFGWKSSKGL